LCAAAQTAKRSPQFAADYQAIAKRRGRKIATTAVACKLLTCAWHLLTDAEHAAPQPEAGSAAPARASGDRPGAVARPRASSKNTLSRATARARSPHGLATLPA
jgi:hypothetical protein